MWRRVVRVANVKLRKQPIREHTSAARAVSRHLLWKMTRCDNQNSETAHWTRSIGSLRRKPSQLLAGVLGLRIEFQRAAEILIRACAVA